MGLMAQAYREMRMAPAEIRRERGKKVFDILRANNHPRAWCIDIGCDNTNWGGFCRLHGRHRTCPPFRLNGGWF